MTHKPYNLALFQQKETLANERKAYAHNKIHIRAHPHASFCRLSVEAAIPYKLGWRNVYMAHTETWTQGTAKKPAQQSNHCSQTAKSKKNWLDRANISSIKHRLFIQNSEPASTNHVCASKSEENQSVELIFRFGLSVNGSNRIRKLVLVWVRMDQVAFASWFWFLVCKSWFGLQKLVSTRSCSSHEIENQWGWWIDDRRTWYLCRSKNKSRVFDCLAMDLLVFVTAEQKGSRCLWSEGWLSRGSFWSFRI